jgi:hypothetical protein
MPAHAEALNDRSSMPPVSVTMHAEKFEAPVPALAELLLSLFGFEPQPATTTARPATPAANRIPLATLPPCTRNPDERVAGGWT